LFAFTIQYYLDKQLLGSSDIYTFLDDFSAFSSNSEYVRLEAPQSRQRALLSGGRPQIPTAAEDCTMLISPAPILEPHEMQHLPF
jgi:hypothetical protein